MPYRETIVEDGREYSVSLLGVDRRKKGPWFLCHACGLPFPRSEGRLYKGSWYGVPCGCAGMLQREITRTASKVLK
jgi:hypothetical protein